MGKPRTPAAPLPVQTLEQTVRMLEKERELSALIERKLFPDEFDPGLTFDHPFLESPFDRRVFLGKYR